MTAAAIEEAFAALSRSGTSRSGPSRAARIQSSCRLPRSGAASTPSCPAPGKRAGRSSPPSSEWSLRLLLLKGDPPGRSAVPLVHAAIAEVTGRRCLRLGLVPDPAQKAEGALTQGRTPEQSRADDRQYHRHFDDGDNLAKHRVEHPDADGSRQRGCPRAHRAPGEMISPRWRGTCMLSAVIGAVVRCTSRHDRGQCRLWPARFVHELSAAIRTALCGDRSAFP
jgi:hypothetical protein